MIKLVTFIALLLSLFFSCFLSAEEDVAYLARTDHYWQVWLIDSDTQKKRQLTRSTYDKNTVSWYPDGKHLLVNGNQGELVKVAIDTGKETAFELPDMGFYDARLSPDGKRIAYSYTTRGATDGNDIWTVDLNTRKTQRLTPMKWLQHEPAWSPDGQFLYFLSGNGGQVHDIWQIDMNNNSQQQLTVGQLYNFDVSVNKHNELVFSSNRSGNYELWWMDPKQQGDKRFKQLTNHPGFDASPSWSPDASHIVFESTREGKQNLWLYSLKDKSVSRLTSHPVGARKPVWKPAL